MTTPIESFPPEHATAPSDLVMKLGYAGLIPFVGGALFIWLLAGQADNTPFVFVVDALSKYAAVVISFLGGMNWGMVMRASPEAAASHTVHRALWTGIAYSLAAWVAVCMPAHAGLVVHGGLLIACYISDRKTYPALGVAPWLTLRFRLTTLASLSCFVAAAQI